MTSNLLGRLLSSHIKQVSRITGIFLSRTYYRRFHRTINKTKEAYEGDGKTTMSILNKDSIYGLMVESYSQIGFRLNNGLAVLGPMAIFPKSVLSWQVHSLEEITEESLSLFSLLEPKLDLLILGISDLKRTMEFDARLLAYSKRHKINMEIVTAQRACAIFNFMNAEGRYVGAGIIPPKSIKFTESEILDDSRNYIALEKFDD